MPKPPPATKCRHGLFKTHFIVLVITHKIFLEEPQNKLDEVDVKHKLASIYAKVCMSKQNRPPKKKKKKPITRNFAIPHPRRTKYINDSTKIVKTKL
jgi:hypothetical protein